MTKQEILTFLRAFAQACRRLLLYPAVRLLRAGGGRRFAPLYILSFFIFLVVLLTVFRPAARQQQPVLAPIAVETSVLVPQHFRVAIESFGTVQPRTRSTIAAQVGGEVIRIHPSFRAGGVFEQGELLLEIDPRDYQEARTRAEADLAEARQRLAEEQAMGEQARADWQRMGETAPAPALVLRRPQRISADARVQAGAAALQRAERDLEKTRVSAPYAGRILQQHADVGHVVAAGTPLAEIYAVDYVEVRLPLKNSDLPFIDLPERYRFEDTAPSVQPQVILHSSLAPGHAWHGRIVRTEGAIDDASRQLHVIAQVDDPYGSAVPGRPPLKIGQYVTAAIAGRALADVIVIPGSAIYQGSYVYIAKDGILQRRTVDIAWRDGVSALVRSGLRAGDMLVRNPLGRVSSGIAVRVVGEAAASNGAGERSQPMPGPGEQL